MGESIRVVLLMADTGAGHRSSAEAVAEAFRIRYGDSVDVSMVDALRAYAPFPLNRLDRILPYMIRYHTWGSTFALTNSPGRARTATRSFWPFVKPHAVRLLNENRADVLVSVHPLINHVLLRAMGRGLVPNTPFVTLVTDLSSFHAVWLAPGATEYLVPTEAARERALRCGAPPNRLSVVGLPIHPDFLQASRRSKPEAKRLLGLEQRPTVLLMAGGDGLGPIYRLARTIAMQNRHAQLVVVAGRNERLRARLEATDWEIPTRIYGFTREMPGLMSAADLLVSKAGPSTLTEALACGLPVILSGYVPGQEKGNVQIVEEARVGALITQPGKIARQVKRWLGPEADELARMSDRARALSSPEAAFNAAERIYELAVRIRNGEPTPTTGWGGGSLFRLPRAG